MINDFNSSSRTVTLHLQNPFIKGEKNTLPAHGAYNKQCHNY